MRKPSPLERYQTIFGRAGVGIGHVRLDGRFIDVNPAFCDLVGYTRDELVRRSFQDITVPEDLAEDLENLRRLVAGEITEYSMMKRYVHERGHHVWIDLTVTLVRPRHEEPYAVAVARDVTQRYRELRAVERERDAFFELSPDPFVIVELRGGEPSFRRVNPAMCTLLGRPKEELQSRPIYTWIHPDDLAYTKNLAVLALEQRLPTSAENRYLTADGDVRWLSWTMKTTDDFFFCVARDVTDAYQRARADAEQQRRLAAASKLSALGRMAANISHEIKNPLTVIYGSACQLQASLGPDVPETAARMLAEVQTMSLRIVKIIDGLRGFSREATRDPFEVVTLRKVLEDLLSFTEARFTKDHLDFSCQPFASDVYVRCQPVQIQQVLLNLLNNAFDAAMARPEGRRALGIRHGATLDRVHLCVFDSGAGIPPVLRPRLFEAFFTTKQVGKGTGLGLNIAHEIVAAHQGSIYLDESQSDTTFVIELPRVYP